MTRAEAIYNFFSGFGLTAYEVNTVPPLTALPYLTFTDVRSAFNEGEVNCIVNVWMESRSNVPLLAVDDELFETIGNNGIVISFDGGAVWLKRGSPWSQTIADPEPNILRRQINITMEYLGG